MITGKSSQAAIKRRRTAHTMLFAREQVQSRQRMIGQIEPPRRVGAHQGTSLHPIFVGRIELHCQRAGAAFTAFFVAAVDRVGDRVIQRQVREWEQAFEIKQFLAIAVGALGLRPTIVHAS